ncbi:ribosomal protein S5-alanine N-acetyltransferase [Vibrio tritonius]|uniref:ribosomal protein S5-alanine N-acetyltransferase n=1 Tax=Vibrio tritonius TaxID=1435069 RepID=UPI000AE5D15E|nr:ribosomal protein S5-alanine N-acetyltransferase [Vibrio tritonius]
MLLTTARTRIEILNPEESHLLLNFYQQNREHLAPWEPIRASEYYTKEYWHNAVAGNQTHFEQSIGFHFVALTAERDQVIGVANFTNVARGAFQACFLGYCISKPFEGQGYMTEILEATIDYLFTEQKLHRIMANYIPDNKGSERVLEKLGFEREGYAKRYLKIAGQWQDHILMSKINPLVE